MSFLKNKHVLIDLEALGDVSESNCVVTYIAARVFDGDIAVNSDFDRILADTVSVKLCQTIQERDGLIVNPETLSWWLKQDEAVKEQCFYRKVSDLDPEEALKRLNHYMQSQGVDKNTTVWTRGTAYDIPKLLNLYKTYGVEPVFDSWKVADTKSVFLGRSNGYTNQYGIGGYPIGFKKHNAMHDVALEVYKLSLYFQDVNKGAWVKPAGEKAKKAAIEGEKYEEFKLFVLNLIGSAEKTYTKDVKDGWALTETGKDFKTTDVRQMLYQMASENLIKSVKSGMYSHWEIFK